ncbi:hypothetical protein K8R04_01960 [Candidatus Uhrbacteria bacterium]|nr:hypothetical protein [Candidatus Uhrbacteria bacterium]
MSVPVIGLTRLFLSETFGSIIRFPFWWYTEGLIEAARWCARGLRFRWESAGISVWVKNFFVPMYGQYDIAGRLVSVVMRFFVLIGRLIGLVFEAIGYALLLTTWVILPVASLILFVDALFRNLIGR